MSLNIKNKEAHALATKVAKLTGETLTEAVTTALRERLETLEGPVDEARSKRLLKIGRDCAAHMSPDVLALDVNEFLYDDKGLPK